MKLSKFGIGSWVFGGPWKYGWGAQDEADSLVTLDCAIEHGINWVDTAGVYGLGRAEHIIGQFAKHRKLIIATKGGLVWDQKGDISKNLDPDSLQLEVENSLKRLRVDCIDLYQLHWPDPKRDARPAWERLVRLREQGKIQKLGLSNFWIDELHQCTEIHPPYSVQLPLNFLENSYEKEVIPFCIKHGIKVLAYSPFQSGLFSGRFFREKLDALALDDWRKNHKYFQEPRFSLAMSFIEKLQEKFPDSAVRCMALAWVASRRGVDSVIIGARNPEQLGQTLACDESLTSEMQTEIEALRAEYFIQYKWFPAIQSSVGRVPPKA